MLSALPRRFSSSGPRLVEPQEVTRLRDGRHCYGAARSAVLAAGRHDAAPHVGHERCHAEQDQRGCRGSLFPLGRRGKTVADAVTIMIPTAAQVTSPGRIRVIPGRMSPTAARTSAAPRKSVNHLGSDAFIWSRISAGGDKKSQSVREKRERKEYLKNPNNDVHDRPFRLVRLLLTRRRGKPRSTGIGRKDRVRVAKPSGARSRITPSAPAPGESQP